MSLWRYFWYWVDGISSDQLKNDTLKILWTDMFFIRPLSHGVIKHPFCPGPYRNIIIISNICSRLREVILLVCKPCVWHRLHFSCCQMAKSPRRPINSDRIFKVDDVDQNKAPRLADVLKFQPCEDICEEQSTKMWKYQGIELFNGPGVCHVFNSQLGIKNLY